MAPTEKFQTEVELKSPAHAFWCAVRDLNFIYPKLFPEIYKSIDILEGDGRSAGTIRVVNYAEDAKSFGKSFKSKIESLDEENKTVLYRVLEGDILKYYKFFDEMTTVKANDTSGSTVVVWTCFYEKTSEESPGGEVMKDSVVPVFNKLDTYVLANNKN